MKFESCNHGNEGENTVFLFSKSFVSVLFLCNEKGLGAH